MYRNSGQQNDKLILWGAPVSFWTGRMQFLRKLDSAFLASFRGHDLQFDQHIRPNETGE